MGKTLFVALTVCLLMTSCCRTEYRTMYDCYTCYPYVFGNEEYSEEKFGQKKREQDSIDEEFARLHPTTVTKTQRGYYRVLDIRKDYDIMVLILEAVSDSTNLNSRYKQVFSLADKPYYFGKSIKIGEVYYFELSPLWLVNTSPPFGIIPDQKEEILFENRWVVFRHAEGENIFSSVNLNGDKYIRHPRKKKINRTR